jgi:lipid II:glycine glycyltransferase (peptidoglycan interpeptide bridge formation enzyme)
MGPLGDDAIAAWTATLRRRAWGERVALVRIDPEIEAEGGSGVVAALERSGWRPAPSIQPVVSRVVDLRPGEAALWSDLRKKWRQYVNKARAAGVTVVDVDADRLPEFHAILTETARRAGTRIRAASAYRDVWDAFRPSGQARLLFAVGSDGDAQAALLVVRCGARVVEPYGGMTAAGAASRANYLVKWEAIRSAAGAGAVSYDMWGLVHPGIEQFKAGFGGREMRYIGGWELPIDRLGTLAYRSATSVTQALGGLRRRRPAHPAVAASPDEERAAG